MPVDYVVDASGLRGTTLDSTIPHTVSIEVGRQGSEEAVAFGYEACLAFLRAHGAIDDEPPTFTEKTVVAGDEEVPKGGGEPTVHFANFEEIPAGSVFAEGRRVHPPRRGGGCGPDSRERRGVRGNIRDLRPGDRDAGAAGVSESGRRFGRRGQRNEDGVARVHFAVGVTSPTASITCIAALAASPRATSSVSASAMPASSSSGSGVNPAETG